MRKLGLVVIGFALAAPAQASEGHGGEEHAFPFHHVSLFVGGASESRPATASEHDFALGAEYEVRLAPRWGIGALVEGVGHDTIRDLVVLGLGSYHFGGGFRVVTGPGVEAKSTMNSCSGSAPATRSCTGRVSRWLRRSMSTSSAMRRRPGSTAWRSARSSEPFHLTESSRT